MMEEQGSDGNEVLVNDADAWVETRYSIPSI